MAATTAKRLLLTGRPGVGKTSLIMAALRATRVDAGGFYTGEIREGGQRLGFSLTTLDGRQTVLAHVDFPGPHRVGRYGVSLENLDTVGVDAIHRAMSHAQVVVVDEIGKMELLSEKFRQAILAAFASGKKVLATITESLHPFAAALKARKEVQVVTITPSSREQVLARVTIWLTDRP